MTLAVDWTLPLTNYMQSVSSTIVFWVLHRAISSSSFEYTQHLFYLRTLVNVYVDLLVFMRIAGSS